ncbi:Hypothetical protein CINCED_3A003458 [Cinara cedri]|uniref:Uncharacterized protein n=1 Tax=Cinara cedri TaxID=506608 RepID=A0A5E4MCN4_9HEMI|nr:Hypothetical protein CINCED_3A003458 [Cinara cedri]
MTDKETDSYFNEYGTRDRTSYFFEGIGHGHRRPTKVQPSTATNSFETPFAAPSGPNKYRLGNSNCVMDGLKRDEMLAEFQYALYRVVEGKAFFQDSHTPSDHLSEAIGIHHLSIMNIPGFKNLSKL